MGLYWGSIRFILGLYRGYDGIMEKKMETTVFGHNRYTRRPSTFHDLWQGGRVDQEAVPLPSEPSVSK